MPKRKRCEGTSSFPALGSSPSRLISRQKKLCSQQLETSTKALISALRLGAGFERQKYSRRRKAAKDKNDEKAVVRLDAEYAVLKSLEFAKVAEQHLRKTVQRVKSIRDNEALPRSVSEVDREVKEQVALNVCARLYKVHGVRKVVNDAINDLKEILGVEAGIQKAQVDAHKDKVDSKQKKVRKDQESIDDLSDEDGETFAAFDARIAAPSSAGEDSDDSLSEGHRPPSVEDSEDDFSEDNSEDSILSDLASLDDESRKSVSPSDITSSADSDSEGGSSMPPPKPKPRTKDHGTASKSTFLPSLTMGGYYSGTDSEASDLDIDVAPRRNRRGQRARQQIWEKKFGEKAKHVQKQERNKGWDTKKGAVDSSRSAGKGRTRGMKPSGRGPERSGENALPLGPRKATRRDDVGQLHPSWQAAKAAKEKKMDLKPQGKKVVFD
ncbi:Bud-site selection protein [Lindgomyces ingoldianus]|uniref:Bud-site selection protein n=1 Tax=Lindgomyces ingoldianus TaxID=673940 RepID=A0ACB6R133_9PLEO|nr:Bud-site selection protein [Lindgomyces ingoldianus]KAF2472480.1 Bud-site selection protein [Lindgomyces ingoldianus]